MNSALQFPEFKVGDPEALRRECRFPVKIYNAPFMDGSDITRSMNINFRKLSLRFDKHCEVFNAVVDNYNHDAKCRDKKKKTITQLRTKSIDQQLRKLKIKKHAPDPKPYNDFIIAFNEKEGTNYPLKRKQPLKQGYDVIVSVLLKYYCAQLTAHIAKKRKNNLNLAIALPALVTNTHRILSYKQEGLVQMSCDKRTVLRQIKRLEAAGILQHISHGAKACSEIYFNPMLLNIQEKGAAKSIKNAPKSAPKQDKKENSLTSQNQSSTSLDKTNCTVLGSLLTRTIKTEEKRKEVSNFKEIRNGAKAPTVVEPEHFNQNTQKVTIPKIDNVLKNVKKIEIPPGLQKEKDPAAANDGPGKEIFKAQPQSVALLAQVDHVFSLSRKLADHHFDHYEPISQELLEWEVKEGSLTLEDCRKVLIPDFVKYFAQIYTGIDKHYKMKPWQWSKAIQLLDQSMFKFFNGGIFSKREMVDKLFVYRRMVRMAAYSYRKRPENFPRFPNEYLARGFKLSFFNLEQRVHKIDKQTASRAVSKTAKQTSKWVDHKGIDLAVKAKRRAKRVENDHLRMNEAIALFLDPNQPKWTINYLENYCSNKLLKEVYNELDSRIKELKSI